MPSSHGSHKTVWERHRKRSEKGVWKHIMDSLVSHGYQTGLVDADDLPVDSSTVSAKKKGSKRLATAVTGESKVASTCGSNARLTTSHNRQFCKLRRSHAQRLYNKRRHVYRITDMVIASFATQG